MGRAKWKMMEDEERGFLVESEKWVCADEFPHQQYLREYIDQSFDNHICSYCGEDKQAVRLNEIINQVYEALETIFETPDDALPFESHNDIWDDLEGAGLHKEGAGYILRDGFHIMDTSEALVEAGFKPRSDKLISDISESIINNSWVYKNLIESTDEERLVSNWERYWENIITSTKDGKSYEEVKNESKNLLMFMTESLRSNLNSLEKELCKGTELFRCVNYHTVPDPLEATHLWAPPTQFASSQRMSKEGQSRFYASFDDQTPLKEAVKNTTGETACLATFELTKTIRILDFTNLPEARILNCPDVLAYRFFNRFAEDITQPVEDKEKYKYVPTQIIRDIIESELSSAGIMGIKYASVKGTHSENIVLFLDNSSCCEYLSLKKVELHTSA